MLGGTIVPGGKNSWRIKQVEALLALLMSRYRRRLIGCTNISGAAGFCLKHDQDCIVLYEPTEARIYICQDRLANTVSDPRSCSLP